MKKKELVEIIQKVVRHEIKKAVKDLGAAPKQTKQVTENHRMSLTEALAQTETQDEWKSMKTFDAKDARAGFASMQGGFPNQQNVGMAQTLANPTVQKDESLQNAFTRDYSDLVKAMTKK